MDSKQQNKTGKQIAVVGLGYVGCVTAACLAKLGHSVMGIDKDAHKVENVNARRAPFYEPGLDDLLKEAHAAGRVVQPYPWPRAFRMPMSRSCVSELLRRRTAT